MGEKKQISPAEEFYRTSADPPSSKREAQLPLPKCRLCVVGSFQGQQYEGGNFTVTCQITASAR
jgi:hypothetical protein